MKMKDNENEFENSWVIVTGGSRGIGRQICYEFASKGANVVIIYLKNHSAAQKTLTELKRFRGSTKLECVDVSNYDAVKKSFLKIHKLCGTIDVLVNCAGIIRDDTIDRLSIGDWNQVINTNLTGHFNCSKNVLGIMKAKNYGRIINISSVVAQMGNIGQTNYAASKGGIIGLTKSLALETAKYDITVNAICPGFIETDMLKNIPLEIKQKILTKIPKGRFGYPEEISRLVAFLASPKSGYVTGQVLNINGGLYM